MKKLILLFVFFSIDILEVKMATISKEDILKKVPDDKLVELRDFFQVDWPSHSLMYNFIDTTIKMKIKDKEFEKYVNIYAPNGNWSDGTIVGIVQFVRNDLVLYSFDKTLMRLKEALRKTKIIDWTEAFIFPALKAEFVGPLGDLKKDISHPFIDEFHADTWRLPKEKALEFAISIPEGYFLAPVNKSHIDTIFFKKPRKRIYPKEFTLKMLETNGGIGIFFNKTNELHGWMLKNYLGAMSTLHVLPKFRRKGLGSTIVKIFAKIFAEEGIDSIANIEPENKISQHMFEKLGFIKGDSLTWLYDTVNNNDVGNDSENRFFG